MSLPTFPNTSRYCFLLHPYFFAQANIQLRNPCSPPKRSGLNIKKSSTFPLGRVASDVPSCLISRISWSNSTIKGRKDTGTSLRGHQTRLVPVRETGRSMKVRREEENSPGMPITAFKHRRMKADVLSKNRYFAAEIIGNVLEVAPRLWRKPRRVDFGLNQSRTAKFKSQFEKYDWTSLIGKN